MGIRCECDNFCLSTSVQTLTLSTSKQVTLEPIQLGIYAWLLPALVPTPKLTTVGIHLKGSEPSDSWQQRNDEEGRAFQELPVGRR